MRVVVGVPAYDERMLAEALQSIVGQAHPGFAIVVVDDSPAGAAGEVARTTLASLGPARVGTWHVERPAGRLGLVAAWGRCLAAARELHPDMELFAWAGDHDRWHPGLLVALEARLAADRGLVLAYPQAGRFGAGAPPGWQPWSFDTAAGARPLARFARVVRRMRAGDMVYGLFRASALEAAGGLHAVLLPDRLLLAQLALAGRFAQVPEVLWERRVEAAARAEPVLARQRRRLFAGAPPSSARLPWPLVHAVLVARTPGVPRWRSLAAACAYPLLEAGFRGGRLLLSLAGRGPAGAAPRDPAATL